MKHRLRLALAVLIWLVPADLPAAPTAPATQPAKLRPLPAGLHKKFVCTTQPAFHCNVYVPKTYKPSSPAPVLYVFAPGGDAPADLFGAPAEKLGWLVCASIESKNGQELSSYSDILNAMRGEMAARFALHPRREYFAGLSGGSRVSLGLFFQNPNTAAGVIAMAAGFNQPIAEVPGGAIAGIAGKNDFNYLEYFTLATRCQDKHIGYQFTDFSGGHEWAPRDLIAQAMEWLDGEYFIRSPNLTDAEAARRPAVLDARLKQIAAMGSTMPAYEACELLQQSLNDDADADKKPLERAAQTLETLKPKLAAELQAREAFRKAIADSLAKPTPFQQTTAIQEAAKAVAATAPKTFYGQRAAALAGSLTERLKLFPPELRK